MATEKDLTAKLLFNSAAPAVERYFDNAATTPVDPRVLREMLPYLEGECGNANSIHGFGLRAMAGVELATERIARLIGAEDPAQIVFTSGATESNNWVLNSFSDAWVSFFEHRAIIEPAIARRHKYLSNKEWAVFPPEEPAGLVSLMSVNNETGVVWDAARLAPRADKVHSDITQQVGKLATDVSGLDFASFSGHKFYGPKGVGALYQRGHPLKPWILGGEQQHGLRAGTLNVPGIVGMGAAAAIAFDELDDDLAKATKLRSVLTEGLERVRDARINQAPGQTKSADTSRAIEPAGQSPYILSVSFLGIQGETLVVEMDRAGYAISSGAACSSHSTQPSHVLLARGVDPAWIRGTVRISLGRFNTPESAEGLLKNLLISVEMLRRMK